MLSLLLLFFELLYQIPYHHLLTFFITLVYLTMIPNVHLLTEPQSHQSFTTVDRVISSSIMLLFHSIAHESILNFDFLLHRGSTHPLLLLILKLFFMHRLLDLFLLKLDFSLSPKYDFLQYHMIIDFHDL